MTFLMILIRVLLLAACFPACSAFAARAASWQPERLPGSARLALDDIRTIYLPPEPSDLLVAALEDLIQVWPGVIERDVVSPSVSKRSVILIRDEHTEGFSLRRARTKVYLRASSDKALASGLYAIARELLGARWYWPGELGFERVGEVADKFPEGIWLGRPAFVQRTLYPVGSDFGRRNGLNRKYSFNHNLARIFTAEVFEESPEVFAEIGGVRQSPGGSAGTDPQPDFTEPEAVALASEAAREYFRENPDANSFSLSINDNSLFDESRETEAVVRGYGIRDAGYGMRNRVQKKIPPTEALNGSATDMDNSPFGEGSIDYFRGRPNYTDLVFGFMNEVAERLERTEGGDLKSEEKGCWFQLSALKSQPSAPYLTALAYYATEQSPSFRIHPRVMPVLTSDRAQWHDPAYRAQDKALIRRWTNSGAERIATWDYYFGAPYPYPRQFTQWIGESIKYLHKSGVDVFFSQLPSIWGLDGPKAWLAAELLREPEQKVEVLLDEYYRNFFGPAAEPIRQFYEIAEQTRNERAGTANWIKFYKDEAGIELFDEKTLRRMRDCLDRAMLLVWQKSVAYPLPEDVGPSKHRYHARVKVVSEAFAYTESYAAYHRSRVRLVEEAMAAFRKDRMAEDGGKLLTLLMSYREAKASFKATKRDMADKPFQGGFKAFNHLKQSDPLPLALAALTHAGIDLMGANLSKEAAHLSILGAWLAGKASFVRSGKNPKLNHLGTELRNFLGPELPVIDAWAIEYRASEGMSINAASGKEASGLRIENADIVSLAQTYPVLGEKAYLLQIEASWRLSPDNRTRVQLNWRSVAGERLRTEILLRLPNGASTVSQQLRFALHAPANAYDLKVGIVTNRQYEDDFLEIRRVEFGELVPDQ